MYLMIGSVIYTLVFRNNSIWTFIISAHQASGIAAVLTAISGYMVDAYVLADDV